MPGWRSSVGSGPPTSMRSSATSIACTHPHERRRSQGERDDPSRGVRTGPGQRGAGTEGRGEVDARPRQGAAPFAGEGLAGPHRPGAPARVGALRGRRQPGRGGNREPHLGGTAHSNRDQGEASRGPQGARVRRYPVGARSLGSRHPPDAVAQHRSPLHLHGRGRVAHRLRRAGSPARRNSDRAHHRRRSDEVRRLAAAERGVREAVRRRGSRLGCRRPEALKHRRKDMESTLQNPAVGARTKATNIAYWIITALFCLQMGFTAYAQLSLPQVARMFTHLGFPDYFRVELSWAKIVGVVLLLAPVPAWLKEWAYA